MYVAFSAPPGLRVGARVGDFVLIVAPSGPVRSSAAFVTGREPLSARTAVTSRVVLSLAAGAQFRASVTEGAAPGTTWWAGWTRKSVTPCGGTSAAIRPADSELPWLHRSVSA